MTPKLVPCLVWAWLAVVIPGISSAQGAERPTAEEMAELKRTFFMAGGATMAAKRCGFPIEAKIINEGLTAASQAFELTDAERLELVRAVALGAGFASDPPDSTLTAEYCSRKQLEKALAPLRKLGVGMSMAAPR